MRHEGIVLDSTYTSKGFSGLRRYVEEGKIPKGSNVGFMHTDGTFGLFGAPDIIKGLY